MVLGLRSKHKRGASVKVAYIVHVQEIRPWPPSESLKSVQTVLLQWENGNQNSGSFLSTARDSKIVFDESFKLPLILNQDKKVHDKFQKNYLEFSLFLPRKDKSKAQLLGTAVLNLADYGIIEHTLSINALVNLKKSSKHSVQSVLVISLEPVEKGSSNSSPGVGLSKEPSLDNDNDDEIASYTDDDASSQSSRTAGSSTFEAATSSPSQTGKNGYGNSGFDQEQNRNVWPSSTDASSDTGNQVNDDVSFSKFYERSTTAVKKNSETPFIRPSHSSISRLHVNGMPNSTAASVSHYSNEVIVNSKHENIENTQQSVEGNFAEGFAPEAISTDNDTKVADNSNSANSLYFHDSQEKPFLYERSTTSVKKNSETPFIRPSHSSISRLHVNRMPNTTSASFMQEGISGYCDEVIADSKDRNIESTQQYMERNSSEGFAREAISTDNDTKIADNSNSASSLYFHGSQEKELQSENSKISDPHIGLVKVDEKMELKDSGLVDQITEEMSHFPENKLIETLSEDDTREQIAIVTEKAPEIPLSSSNKARLKHVKSVQIHGSVEGNRPQPDIHTGGKPLDPGIPDDCPKEGELGAVIERKEPKDQLLECKTDWKTRVEMLEEELREAAATEVGLYSVVAEHASSGNKVHAPARRLSRFYANAFREGSQAKRASAARAAVSGLVLVSKSCGNDVPRLTFWLSNSIMLRAIVSQTAAELPYSNEQERKSTGTGSELTGRFPRILKDSSHVEEHKSKYINESDDGEDVPAFIIALEKVESWLFSRIVESLWWQTFTPHMQPSVAKNSDVTSGSGTKKTCGRRNSLGNYEQGNFSTELWTKAFKDACERLCPIRAGGHECGCLSVLVRLVMEQLVNRLDMAMFNAILRESAEEMPTDPLSDPISDSKVLPIPAGKSSFGAGVELKNSIGNWSRWLTDLFGLEDDSTEHIDLGDGKNPQPFKAFRLLHALSDLMMLPLGMFADASTRKEVCPMFGPTIIKRVLNSFVPDEFCPDPIPQNIIDALDTEEVSDASDDTFTTFPCTASPTKYSPPPAALLTCVGEVGSQVLRSSRLSSLKKSYISDDELDELDSPFTSIIPDIFQDSALAKLGSIPKEKGGRNVIRYKLLREVWKDDE